VFVAGLIAIGVWRFRIERRRLAALVAAAPPLERDNDPEPEPVEHQ